MLFLKELKKICFSIVYLLFLILLIFGWYKNFYGVTDEEITSSIANEISEVQEITGSSILQKPDENAETFGRKSKEVPDKIMLGGTDHLLMEYLENSYATYPFSYYKEVILSDKEQSKILDVLCEITGLTEQQLKKLPSGFFPSVNGSLIHYEANEFDENGKIEIKDNQDNANSSKSDDKTKQFVSQVSYERYKELMNEVEDVLGNGSYYSMDMLKTYYGQEEMDYNEAMEEYNKTIYDDKISTAFARLFCDYTTRSLGLYPVFVAVTFWLKDRKNRMNELIDNKQSSTCKIVTNRYLAILTAVIIPVVILSFESLMPILQYSSSTGIAIDILAFLKYILWWLLPTTMIVTALGMFLTILTSTPLAIIIQGIWWFVDSGVTGLSGDTSLFTLMIRHNTLTGSELITQNAFMIWINRGLLVFLSLVLVFLACLIYDMKRRGKLNYEYHYQRYWGIIKERFCSIIQK